QIQQLTLQSISDYLFFFQAEDGIRDRNVTGVQTCALPISRPAGPVAGCRRRRRHRSCATVPATGPAGRGRIGRPGGRSSSRSGSRRLGTHVLLGWTRNGCGLSLVRVAHFASGSAFTPAEAASSLILPARSRSRSVTAPVSWLVSWMST